MTIPVHEPPLQASSSPIYILSIIRFGFCDIQNNHGLGKDYQLYPLVSVDNLYLDFDYSGYHKNLIHVKILSTYLK